MWMMGYSDAGEINAIQDPFTGRKLRPLMPRPAPALTRIHNADLFALNHHLAMTEQNKRDLTLTTQQVVVSSRWNPTPEQLQTLEELYRRGTRTPSAEQIQHITAQLRRYGKIEGKNVFYWFQNHKARERQKRRRQLETTSFPDEAENGEKREVSSGANRTLFEVEQTKNWASPTNSSTAAEKSGEAEAECKADDGWVHVDDDAELQRRRNATWRMMNLSCSSSSTNVINSSSVSATTPSTLAATSMQFKPHHFINIFLEPSASDGAATVAEAEAQTLELFPLRSGREEGCSDNEEEEEEEESGVDMRDSGGHVTPCQFFEFLPLKN